MKITLVLGIRPDVIRASKIIKILRTSLGKDFELVWTGQHYSNNLKDIFFEELNVGFPDVELGIIGETDAELVASGIMSLSAYLIEKSPDVVVFLGDTNTVMTCVAAAQLNIPIIHIEGCMRSFDWRMPEEKNRTVIDHLSDRILTYTEQYKLAGIGEGLRAENIIVTGNPIVEVLEDFIQSKSYTDQLENTLSKRGLRSKNYLVATCHRRENIESRIILQKIFNLFSTFETQIILPLGYRTKKQIAKYDIQIPKNVFIEEPIGYGEFVALMKNSSGVLTDSGTVVEEACILGIPSIQMRHSTERPEVYQVGSSIKFDPSSDVSELETIEAFKKLEFRVWKHMFGDGKASERIAENILNFISHPLPGHAPDMNKEYVQRSFMSHE
jgi:UDP-N-acetylglucosamine 2-epimerase (non-hydrolysing)